MNKTALWLALSVGLLSACSSQDGFENTQKSRLLRQTEIPEVSPQFRELAQSGAPALLASIKDRDQIAAFMRMTTRGGIENWVSASNVSLDFKSGFLISSRGLGGDLMSADASQSIRLVLAGQNGVSKRFHSYLDGEDQTVTRSFICEIISRGARDVDLGKTVIPTRLMQEKCKNGSQSFQNLYWVDLDRQEIIQSRQWVSDYIGGIAFRVIQR